MLTKKFNKDLDLLETKVAIYFSELLEKEE